MSAARKKIGLKTTGNGLIAICNWHLLSDTPEDRTSWKCRLGALAGTTGYYCWLLPLTPGQGRAATVWICSTGATHAAMC